MTRIALGVEYNGTGYSGWQKQSDIQTIQGTLEAALAKIADEPIELTCAGRTDAGVHAIAQVVHFDTTAVRPDRAWTLGTNTHLPPAISVHWVKEVDKEFSARFSALSRCYHYIIHNSVIRSALLASKVTWYYDPLDIEKMRLAAPYLLGEQDFSSFRSAECGSKTAMRNIKKIEITRQGDFVVIQIEANAFLHHMVRNIVGVLKRIGAGFNPPIWAKEVLEAKDRRQAAETAPADGLYLTDVYYPEPYRFPKSAKTLIISEIFSGMNKNELV